MINPLHSTTQLGSFPRTKTREEYVIPIILIFLHSIGFVQSLHKQVLHKDSIEPLRPT